MFKFLSRFNDFNSRELSKLQPSVLAANELASEMSALSDAGLRAQTETLRSRLSAELGDLMLPPQLRNTDSSASLLAKPGAAEERKASRKKETARINQALDALAPEAFAAVREAMTRALGKRHYDVQLLGGLVLQRGSIAEMKTGEGKTLVAPLAAYLNALVGRGVHVVTVNDYLAKRDAQWIGAVFEQLGMSVGSIQHDNAYLYDSSYAASDERLRNLRPVARAEAYAADVTYGTNNEFGFDYLRDNLVLDLTKRVQRGHFYAIVDEVDNILIDEARTPLIISGTAEESADKYQQFAKLAPRLQPVTDYIVDEKLRQTAVTEIGVDKIEKWLGIDNLFETDLSLPRFLDQALRAQALYLRDRDYVVKDGEVIIVDEFTGRLMPGRRWSEGLHQAVEAKEGVRIQNESMTLATVTFQNYFRMYDKLAGMTGTAETEAEEFGKIYGLEVVVIPTNQPMIRDDFGDLIYASTQGKWAAVTEEIIEEHSRGRPILVGTISVEVSEMLGASLKRAGIRHHVLNAKLHEREAEIVAQAGRSGAVTIATNMAGRGTDILLGGNPEVLASELLHKQGTNIIEASPEQYAQALAIAEADCLADREIVLGAGGLHIIGTERHEARRIDNQLRGRAGRQGDPGSSRFYLSLEDDLMRRFASDRVKSMMERFGFDGQQALESRMVSKTIESAQSRVEGHNFDMRKQVVQYDDVINRQRETIYAERDRILRSEDLTPTLQDMLDEEITALLADHVIDEVAEEWNREGLYATVATILPGFSEASQGELDGITSQEEFGSTLTRIVSDSLSARREQLGNDAMQAMARLLLLRIMDSLWVEHLTAIDDMRRAIGLRAYSQRDPLTEFKVEAYRMFEELQETIRHDLTRALFHVTVLRSEQSPLTGIREGRFLTGPEAEVQEAKPATVRNGPKLGRNDPCYCGSGKKFKKCHGA